MYKPAPPRPRKTNIVRAKTGCKGCRKRRTKCDEKKPSCGTCTRLGKSCEQFSPKLEFRAVSYFTPDRQSRPKSGDEGERKEKQPSLETNEGDFSAEVAVAPFSSSQAAVQIPPGADAIPDQTFDITQANVLDSQDSSFSEDDYDEMINRTLRASSSPSLSNWDFSDDGSSLGFDLGIPVSIPPLRDPLNTIAFYGDVWKKQCLPALNTVFHQLEALPDPHLLSTDIVVALSACRLSRTLPQRKIFHISNIPSLCFKPDSGHESISHEYYGTVMRKMAWWTDRDFDAYPTLGLAVLVLFCYLESSMGNFQEFRLHSDGTRRLIRSYEDQLISNSNGAALLAAWVEVEMQNWWRRVYFSTPDFHRNHASLALQPKLEAVLHTGEYQRAFALLILCESHRLNSAAVVSRWDELASREPDRNTIDDSVLAAREEADTRNRAWLKQCTQSLKAQSEKLDAWYALLPIGDLPELWPDSPDDVRFEGTALDIRPLKFSSHTAAMNFAYYAVARVMQCVGPLESLVARESSHLDAAYEEAEAWILILLRITAGIDWEQCIRFNVYTLGLAGLLLACALRSRNPAIGLWIEFWLEKHLQGEYFEEGNFPVFQVLSALRLVNTERRKGRDVFALFQIVDDGGGSGKLGSYHSQRLRSLWVYGRCRETGKLRSYCRALEETSVETRRKQ